MPGRKTLLKSDMEYEAVLIDASESLEEFNTKAQRHEGTKSEDEISHQIIGAAIEVHRIRALGQFWSSLCKGRCFTNNKRYLIDFFVSLSLRVFVFNLLEVS